MPERTCWHQTSDRHFAADLGRIGSVLVWADPSSERWCVFVLGTQRSGLATAAEAQAAALRLARELLVDGLRQLQELEE